MGRWAQRQRTGGAGSTLNFITRVEVVSTFVLLASYRFPVTAGSFTPGTFATLAGEFICTGVANQGASELLLTFIDEVDVETSLRYTGSVTNVLTPQTINLT